jgi:hypothetical protein
MENEVAVLEAELDRVRDFVAIALAADTDVRLYNEDSDRTRQEALELLAECSLRLRAALDAALH